MPSSSIKENRKLSGSGRRRRMRSIGEISDAGWNSVEETMPGVTPHIHPEEKALLVGLHTRPSQ